MKKHLKSTVERLARLEKNLGFLSDVKYDDKTVLSVVNDNDEVDLEKTELLQELQKLNSRRDELLSLLTK